MVVWEVRVPFLRELGVRIRAVYLDFFSTERASSTDTSRDLLPLLKMLEGNLVGEGTRNTLPAVQQALGVLITRCGLRDWFIGGS